MPDNRQAEREKNTQDREKENTLTCWSYSGPLQSGPGSRWCIKVPARPGGDPGSCSLTVWVPASTRAGPTTRGAGFSLPGSPISAPAMSFPSTSDTPNSSSLSGSLSITTTAARPVACLVRRYTSLKGNGPSSPPKVDNRTLGAPGDRGGNGNLPARRRVCSAPVSLSTLILTSGPSSVRATVPGVTGRGQARVPVSDLFGSTLQSLEEPSWFWEATRCTTLSRSASRLGHRRHPWPGRLQSWHRLLLNGARHAHASRGVRPR